MNFSWVTSAAIVGLLASTVIYAWQRSLEHQFLLRKEKREAFRQYLSVLNDAQQSLYKREWGLAKANVERVEGLTFELDLLCAREFVGVLVNVPEYLRRQISSHEELEAEIDYQRRKGEIDEALKEAMKELNYNLGYLHGAISALMRSDLEATATLLPLLSKTAVKRKLEKVGDHLKKLRQGRRVEYCYRFIRRTRCADRILQLSAILRNEHEDCPPARNQGREAAAPSPDRPHGQAIGCR